MKHLPASARQRCLWLSLQSRRRDDRRGRREKVTSTAPIQGVLETSLARVGRGPESFAPGLHILRGTTGWCAALHAHQHRAITGPFALSPIAERLLDRLRAGAGMLPRRRVTELGEKVSLRELREGCAE